MKLPKNDMVKTLYLKIMVIFLTLVSFESLMYLTKWKTWQPYQHQDKRTLVVKPIAAAVTASSSASTKAESDFMKRMEIRMENRKKFLQDACKRLGFNQKNETMEPWELVPNIHHPWFFSADKYGLLYCEIPKSGSTNWKKVILVLNGIFNSTSEITQGKAHSSPISYVKFKPPPQLLEKYQKSLKLIVVRDPFERISSAYLDKIAPKPGLQADAVFSKFSCEVAKKYGKRWKKQIKEISVETKNRSQPLDSSSVCQLSEEHSTFSLQATFEEFVSYLTDPDNSDITHDVIDHGSEVLRAIDVRHWQNFHTLCRPCNINYDVIAHVETLTEDARYTLKLINAEKRTTYPRGYDIQGGRWTKLANVDLFKNIKLKVISQLYELYRKDYELFDYRPPKIIRGN